MNLPLFYHADIVATDLQAVLDEAASKHIVQVLRMKTGEQLQLTNGKGDLFAVEITDENRKRCAVKVISKSETQKPMPKIAIAISIIKNSTRFEWFLEKATEIGVSEIYPLICERTEKEKFRQDRMQQICISAMLQSQQCWLPVLHEPVKFKQLVSSKNDAQKFIAHCEEVTKSQLTTYVQAGLNDVIILIGPEGDFTGNEIEMAIKNDFIAVALGNTRLRTETAGVVAAALLCIG